MTGNLLRNLEIHGLLGAALGGRAALCFAALDIGVGQVGADRDRRRSLRIAGRRRLFDGLGRAHNLTVRIEGFLLRADAVEVHFGVHLGPYLTETDGFLEKLLDRPRQS